MMPSTLACHVNALFLSAGLHVWSNKCRYVTPTRDAVMCDAALSELAFSPTGFWAVLMVDICCWELVVCQGMHVGPQKECRKGDE